MRGRRVACVAALLALGCAQVREITGGEKDAQGPTLISASPPNGSVRFSGDRFVLRFDERVQVERPRTGLLVSPPQDPAPTIQVTGAREVEVRLRAALLPNTTYTFAIGEAVKDLTEGNRASGLSYVLSTGDWLDSLMIPGTVTHAFTEAAQDQVLVMLLAEGDTAGFTKGRPAFATRTDPLGRFVLDHLPANRFHVVALRDLNGNYRYDLPAEEIAFSEELVSPFSSGDSTAVPVRLRLFQEASAQQRMREATVLDDRMMRIVLARPAERLELVDVARSGGQLEWRQEWGVRRDTVFLWPSDTTAVDLGRYQVITEDGVLDTVRYRPLRPMPFHLSVKALPAPEAVLLELRLRTSRPIADVDSSRISIVSDSLAIPFQTQLGPDDRTLVLRTQLEPNRRAEALLLPKTLRDIYGGSHDTLRFTMGGMESRSLGILRVTIQVEPVIAAPFILELLDAQGNSVRRTAVQPNEPMTWERLTPGNHTLRLIADANGNGRWDPGQWATGTRPERVWLHQEPINVRAAWDLGIVWKPLSD
ncbi:MAG: Ig-like domain-containing protein [Flavobacteriales bacterium]|nr:Ig-like domain-containing protein [Flavobacteriales bacterium]